MKEFVNRIILFIVVLFLGLQVFDYTVPYYWFNKGVDNKMRFLKESDKDFNTFFFGSSKVFRHVMPSVIDSLNIGKTKSFNLGYAATFNPEMYFLVDNFIQENSFSPSFIFVELQGIRTIANVNMHSAESKYYMDYSTCLFTVNSINASKKLSKEKKYDAVKSFYKIYIEKLLKISLIHRYLEYWLVPRIDTTILGEKKDGFFSLDAELKKNPNNQRLQKRISELTLEKYEDRYLSSSVKEELNCQKELNKVHFKMLLDLIGKGKEKGIEIIYFGMEFRGEMRCLFEHLPNERKIEVDDMNQENNLNKFENFMDIAHFNEKGARVYSDILGNKIRRHIEKHFTSIQKE